MEHAPCPTRSAPCHLSLYCANSASRQRFTSPLRGIRWQPNLQCWRVDICANSGTVCLGEYNEKKTAARAFDRSAQTMAVQLSCPVHSQLQSK